MLALDSETFGHFKVHHYDLLFLVGFVYLYSGYHLHVVLLPLIVTNQLFYFY